MKDYLKPEIEYIKFKAEEIASLIGGEDGYASNDFSEDDFE